MARIEKAVEKEFSFSINMSGTVKATTIEHAEELLDNKFMVSNDENIQFRHHSVSVSTDESF